MSKTRSTRTRVSENELGIVYSSAYPLSSTERGGQAHYQASPEALPESLYVGGSGCEHPIIYQRENVCLLCFFMDGFQNELPRSIHLSKVLAENGNPAQSPSLESHVQVVSGFRPPKPDQTMKNFRLAREQYTRPAHGKYPFASALWELMSFQPPLATPTILLISGEKAPKIAEKLSISVYNAHERISKGINLAFGFLRI